AQAIASLSHPNVCVLHDVGSHEGIDFLVMEYLDGDSLEARLREGPLAVDDALTIAIQVAMGLEHAHRAGVVHRDLKPGNVMITRSGVKVLDFGLAKFTTRAVCGAPPNLRSTLTDAGAMVGTLPYVAPEQLEGREADARTDVYALALLIFEMVTGRAAFRGATPTI